MIELKNIVAGYGKKDVLSGVNAVFEKGSLTSIVGKNGCGKSTLLKTVINILPARGGEIQIDGDAVLTLSRKEIARRVAYLSQGRNVPEMTVEQMVLHGRFPHLKYPRRYTGQDTDAARKSMELVGIAEYAIQPIHTLSGGMRQNVYIAMALTQDTDYILLDEPTTYLDIGNQLELMGVLRGLADSGKGIVTVMHDLPMAFNFSDKVIVIDGGQTAEEGRPEDVKKSGIIEEVFGVGIEYDEREGKYFYRY